MIRLTKFKVTVEFSVLVRKETVENDEASLEEMEKIQADVVKLANEGNLVMAGLENQLVEIEVNN